MKSIIVLILSLLTMQIARSQVKFGIKAGLNFTNLSISGANVTSHAESKTDFNAGILANVHLFNSFILQPELVYSGQGSSTTDSSGKLNYGYFNIPILLKYQHATGFFVETGPQLGILLSANYKTANSSINQTDFLKSSDLAWVFGLGYKIPVINLGLDLRYNLGLNNIENSDIVTIKNQVYQISVFYIF